MVAVPKIRQHPLRKPWYNITPEAMATESSFRAANDSLLRDWYEQLRAVDPEDFCDFAEFCGVQYDIEQQKLARYRDESAYRYESAESYAADDAGMPLRDWQG